MIACTHSTIRVGLWRALLGGCTDVISWSRIGRAAGFLVIAPLLSRRRSTSSGHRRCAVLPAEFATVAFASNPQYRYSTAGAAVRRDEFQLRALLSLLPPCRHGRVYVFMKRTYTGRHSRHRQDARSWR